MKEVNGVRISFEIQEDSKLPPGFNLVHLMMIFYIKMDFIRKASLLTRGDLTDTPPALTYSSVVSRESVHIARWDLTDTPPALTYSIVVSRESVHIAFLMAELNDLEVLMFDVGNAYLNVNTTKKLYLYSGKVWKEK
jgi:hypothetical protein